ncbi:MAG: V-type ATP synthase subunit K [Candidatus Omnitrophica bacterium]|nr:V-type ATP synthase subunit K [Candidatus Omnitrophota bacterium]
MEQGMVAQFKDLGAILVLALAAVGSGWGTGIAGMSAIGAWKKSFLQNKPASFMLIVFTAAPLTQTVYGMIVMRQMLNAVNKGFYLWSIGAFSGLAIGLSALWQGRCAAVACDAMGETGKGFANYLVVLGMVETVALLVMAFSLMLVGSL